MATFEQNILKCEFIITGEGADEADSNALAVIARGVSTLDSPAATLVHVSVSANNEVVTNVGPSIDVHVLILVSLDHGGARRLAAA
jgi:hypothetical protein